MRQHSWGKQRMRPSQSPVWTPVKVFTAITSSSLSMRVFCPYHACEYSNLTAQDTVPLWLDRSTAVLPCKTCAYNSLIEYRSGYTVWIPVCEELAVFQPEGQQLEPCSGRSRVMAQNMRVMQRLRQKAREDACDDTGSSFESVSSMQYWCVQPAYPKVPVVRPPIAPIETTATDRAP